ncbi:EAL and HDOD domain-containing protein [Desulfonatronum thioautotrophicum]|uniref:EAL and HDOD domain-containing protein n=1 Tax=Desulfonatronum thioautotrophicum TaxID=617001 RepID=UPI0005EBB4B5|nr:HDOD domain-containing protein [Desulfonatronum thioautotrophicum]
MQPATSPSCLPVQPCYFARHPIFERDMRLWGYHLLYRDDAMAESAQFSDQDKATIQVALEATVFAGGRSAVKQNLLLEFSASALAHGIPHAMPPQETVIKLTPTLCRNETLAKSITELRTAGYRLALDGPLESCRHILDLASFLIVDALTTPAEIFLQEMAAATKTGIPVLVKRIESPEIFESAKDLGAQLFLGFFFQKPEIIASRKLSSMQVVRLKLLKMLDAHADNWDEIANILQNDVSLAYRLLQFINSPFFGVVQPITTVQRAIGYLGSKRAKLWLRMVILTDLCPPEKTSQLPLLSAQRARFLEIVGANRQDVDGDELFLLGLFSLLDAIFDMPMTDLVDYLPLTADLKATLCRRSGRYAPWLDMAIHFEQGQWDRVDPLLDQLNLNRIHVGTSYAQAVTWAEDFFHAAG